MRKGKAAGEDHISIKLHKTAGSRFSGELLDLFNIAYNTNVLPKDWQNLNYMPDMEKGDKRDCGIYRGATLLSHAGKLYKQIFDSFIIAESFIGEWQQGWKPGKSTIDLIFKMIFEKSMVWRQGQLALFIDKEKAFDKVNREALWETMSEKDYSIPPKLVWIIKNMYLTNICKTYRVSESMVRNHDWSLI